MKWKEVKLTTFKVSVFIIGAIVRMRRYVELSLGMIY
jgi:hypothetical protein